MTIGTAQISPASIRRRRSGVFYDTASVIVVLVVAVVVLITFRDSEITIDEHNHVEYGNAILEFYGSGLAYDSNLDTPYGGAFDLLGAVTRRLLPGLSPYDAMHLLGGLVGILGLLGAWRLGRLLFGPRAGFWALVFLAITPPYFGPMFNMPKDVPFAAASIWAFYYLCVFLRQAPAVTWRTVALLGVTAGLAMGVRIGGLLLLCYLGLSVGILVFREAWLSRTLEATWRVIRGLGGRALAAATIAWATMLTTWPWALRGPLKRPLVALHEFTNNSHDLRMPFNGRMIHYSEAPWDYLPRYFGYKLPEILLLFALLGAALGIVSMVKRMVAAGPVGNRAIVHFTLGFAILFPPLYAIIRHSTLSGDLRHFLFLVPLLCVLAAGGLVVLHRWLTTRHYALGVALTLVVCAGAVQQVVRLHRLHPHEYAFFNSLVGGLPGADLDYDTTGGRVTKEALFGLRDYLWRTERHTYLNSSYRITGCVSTTQVRGQLPPNFSRRNSRGDFHIGATLRFCDQRHPEAPVISRVRRYGTTLSVVRDLRDPTLRDRWRAQYFDNPDFAGPPIDRTDRNLSFAWSGQSPWPILHRRPFSGRWDSCLVLDEATSFELELSSTNIASVAIDGSTVLENRGSTELVTANAVVSLDAGVHHLHAEYRGEQEPDTLRFSGLAQTAEPPAPRLRGMLRLPEAAGPGLDVCASVRADVIRERDAARTTPPAAPVGSE